MKSLPPWAAGAKGNQHGPKALAEALRADFQPRPFVIAGLAAWHYRGGPWELAMKASFRG